jgi:putative spermidine/putrescine transport system permease protein
MTGRRTGLLILPAFALLTGVFLIPIVWFFARSLTEIEGGVPGILAQAREILLSVAVRNALFTTNWISALVAAGALVIGYPVAYFLATTSGLGFSLVVLCVVVPYFTSIIVRTYAWMVLLGSHGLVNQVLLGLGVIEAPLPLLYNKLGILIGMIYVLLPYMVLTLYAAMRAIDPGLVRAAQGLGASGFYAFRRVYLPLSLHGVLSGSLIVFILAIGFFITPALMGGPSDVMIAMLIEREIEIALDWPGAALMSLTLLALTLALYALYYRVTDLRRLMGAT